MHNKVRITIEVDVLDEARIDDYLFRNHFNQDRDEMHDALEPYENRTSGMIKEIFMAESPPIDAGFEIIGMSSDIIYPSA